jgi:hypothetical protein
MAARMGDAAAAEAHFREALALDASPTATCWAPMPISCSTMGRARKWRAC